MADLRFIAGDEIGRAAVRGMGEAVRGLRPNHDVLRAMADTGKDVADLASTVPLGERKWYQGIVDWFKNIWNAVIGKSEAPKPPAATRAGADAGEAAASAGGRAAGDAASHTGAAPDIAKMQKEIDELRTQLGTVTASKGRPSEAQVRLSLQIAAKEEAKQMAEVGEIFIGARNDSIEDISKWFKKNAGGFGSSNAAEADKLATQLLHDYSDYMALRVDNDGAASVDFLLPKAERDALLTGIKQKIAMIHDSHQTNIDVGKFENKMLKQLEDVHKDESVRINQAMAKKGIVVPMETLKARSRAIKRYVAKHNISEQTLSDYFRYTDINAGKDAAEKAKIKRPLEKIKEELQDAGIQESEIKKTVTTYETAIKKGDVPWLGEHTEELDGFRTGKVDDKVRELVTRDTVKSGNAGKSTAELDVIVRDERKQLNELLDKAVNLKYRETLGEKLKDSEKDALTKYLKDLKDVYYLDSKSIAGGKPIDDIVTELAKATETKRNDIIAKAKRDAAELDNDALDIVGSYAQPGLRWVHTGSNFGEYHSRPIFENTDDLKRFHKLYKEIEVDKELKRDDLDRIDDITDFEKWETDLKAAGRSAEGLFNLLENDIRSILKGTSLRMDPTTP